jgi:hypothetical protein
MLCGVSKHQVALASSPDMLKVRLRFNLLFASSVVEPEKMFKIYDEGPADRFLTGMVAPCVDCLLDLACLLVT